MSNSLLKSTKKNSDRPATTTLKAVSPAEPCPVCGGDHKCSVGNDGLILCGRRSSEVSGFRYLGQAKQNPQFWLYRLLGSAPDLEASKAPGEGDGAPAVDWQLRAERYRAQLDDDLKAELAGQLGLPDCVLDRFGVGWDGDRQCSTIPERDAAGVVIGIAGRHRDGRKRSIKGSRRGLTYSPSWAEHDGPILVPEGFSDTAAADAMALACVGRPSSTGGVDLLAGRLADVPPARAIVVVGENDLKPDGQWPGKQGAVATAGQLARRLNRPVLIAYPPDGAKDIRGWFNDQKPDLDDADELLDLGKTLAKHLLADAQEVVLWDPLLDIDDPDLPDFPVDALPPWQRDFVAGLAEATQTPPDLAGILVLAVTSVAVAKKAVVRVRPGYSEPLNTFAAVALPPASRKTPVFREVVAPIEAFERARAEEVGPAAAEARAKKEIDEKTLEELKRRAAKAEGEERDKRIEEANAQVKTIEETKVPEIPRLLADDVTPEKLASLMAEHGGRMGVLSAEGGIFGIMAGRYSASKNNVNLAVYLKGHAGDTVRVDRVGRAPAYIDRPALTLGLAVQPDVIRGLAQNPGFRGQGLLGRFLYAMPRSLVGHRDVDPPPLPDEARDDYRDGVRALLELPFGTDENGAPAEHVVTLTREAYELWLAFSRWLEPQLAAFGALAHLADWAGKLAGAVVRIAGLFHLADQAGKSSPWSVPIPAATMRRAIEVGEYLCPHARAAFAEMGADPAVADARYVLGWVRRHGTASFTRRDCFEGTKSRFVVVDNLTTALDLLAAHNYIRERPAASRAGRGRPPSPIYDVNPAALEPERATPTAFTPFRPAWLADDPVEAAAGRHTGAGDAGIIEVCARGVAGPRGHAHDDGLAAERPEPEPYNGDQGDYEEGIL
jgi:hypothetical protein